MKIVIANSVGVDSNGYHMVHVPSRWSLGVKNLPIVAIILGN